MKTILNIILAMFACLSINAQAPGRDWSKPNPEWKAQDNREPFSPELYKKKLIQFVTNEAHLTEGEAQKFFPILEEMLGKQHAVMEQNRRLLIKSHKDKNLSEKDYEDIVYQMTENDVKSKKIEQAYTKKFHNVLPWKKVFAVKMALNKWQMEALNHFRPGRRDDRTFRPAWNRKQ